MSGTNTQEKYTKDDETQLEAFVSKVAAAEAKPGMVLDSASAASAAMDALKNASGVNAPRVLDELLGNVTDEHGEMMVKAFFDGVNTYESEHGFRPTGDVLLSAIHQGRSIFDAVTNGHHDQISINPNAPIVAVMGAMAEACPFAGYLPADKGSNEARLIIVNHLAGSDWGDYKASDIMDGVAAGGGYVASARTLELAAPNDTVNYKFTFTKRSDGTGAVLNLLRGRTIVYVNGKRAVTEVANGSSVLATVPVSGTVRLSGTDYTLTGTVKPASGEVSVVPNVAFPAGTVVTCETYVDYEVDPSVTPRMSVQAVMYQLFANPFRVIYQITPESRSQFANEVGLDAGAEAMLAIRGQYALERHYDALKKVKMIGKFQNPLTFDFQYSTQIQQKTQAQIWQNFAAVLGVGDQKMAEDTADHGITHLYVGKNVMAQFLAMPRELFEPSGVTARPGIYRVGRLFGKYEVYYSPKFVNESQDAKTCEIIAVGRSQQTARNPIIFGDASAPIFDPLGVGTDLRSGVGFHARSFTATNPHDMSAAGCALITVTNLF